MMGKSCAGKCAAFGASLGQPHTSQDAGLMDDLETPNFKPLFCTFLNFFVKLWLTYEGQIVF